MQWAVWINTLEDWLQAAAQWAEKHAGLGGWVGAAGAVAAIFITWGLTRAEYLRTRRQAVARKHAEVDLIVKVIEEFELTIRTFKQFEQGSTEAASYEILHTNDPEWHSMRDLASLPVTHWPSMRVYAEFRRYWFYSNQFMQMGGIANVDKAERYLRARQAHDKAYRNLQSALAEVLHEL